MSKCPSGITELMIDVDSVWLVPNNCSYTSTYLSIEARESDIEVTKEIGIVHIEKFEFTPVHNLNLNRTALVIDEIFNGSKSGTFHRNKVEIQEKLAQIETNHVNLVSSYAFEKWLLVGVLCLILALYAAAKSYKMVKNKREEKSRRKVSHENIKLTIRVPNDQLPPQQPFQQPLLQQQLVHSGLTDPDNSANKQHSDQGQRQPQQPQQTQQRQHERTGDKGHVYAEITDPSSISFSSRPEHSQFYSK